MDKNIKERNNFEINIGDADCKFNADEVSCVDQPIAVYAKMYNELYYDIYCFYTIFRCNWEYYIEGNFVEIRNKILKNLGLELECVYVHDRYKLCDEIKKKLDENIPALIYLRRKTLVYDEGYDDDEFDSLHGILVTGYNKNRPILCIRDSAHVENSGIHYYGSGYGMFKLWIRENLVEEMWMRSAEIGRHAEFSDKIYIMKEKSKVKYTYEDMLLDILNNGTFNHNRFCDWIMKSDILDLKDDEVCRAKRRVYILPMKAFFSILKQICEIKRYDIEYMMNCEKIYMNILQKTFGKLCVAARKNEKITIEMKKKFCSEIVEMDRKIEKICFELVAEKGECYER